MSCSLLEDPHDPFLQELKQSWEQTIPHDVLNSSAIRNIPALDGQPVTAEENASSPSITVDADSFNTIHNRFISLRVYGVVRPQCGPHFYTPVRTNDPQTNTVTEQKAQKDFLRMARHYFSTVLKETHNDNQAYLMMHTHKCTHISHHSPHFAYLGPMNVDKARTVQKQLLQYHRQKEQQYANDKNIAYTYYVPALVPPKQLYSMMQWNPASLVQYHLQPPASLSASSEDCGKSFEEAKRQAQKDFSGKSSLLTVTGFTYHIRRFAKFLMTSIVRKLHMFNVDEDMPSVRSNLIERSIEGENKAFQTYCQGNQVRSMEEYMEKEVLLPTAKDGASMRSRLILMCGNRQQKRNLKKQQEEEQEKKQEEAQEEAKRKETSIEEQDEENDADEDDEGDEKETENEADHDNQSESSSGHDNDDNDDDEDDDDDDMSISDMSTQDQDLNAEYDDTETWDPNVINVNTDNNKNVIVQKQLIPEDASVSYAPKEKYTAFLHMDNYQIMEKAMEVLFAWKDVRESFVTHMRRSYVTHYVLAQYIYTYLFNDDLDSASDDDIYNAVVSVFGGHDKRLHEDGDLTPLVEILDNLEEDARDSFYREFKREDALLTCEEWTTFLNQFDFSEILDDLMHRHNERVDSTDKRIKSRHQVKQSFGEISLEQVHTAARDAGMDDVINEDPGLPTLEQLLNGEYVYPVSGAIFDKNALIFDEGKNQYRRKTLAEFQREQNQQSGDHDDNEHNNDKTNTNTQYDEENIETIETLVDVKCKRLFATLSMDAQGNMKETIRLFLTHMADLVLLAPHTNHIYCPENDQKQRRKKGLGITLSYMQRVLMKTITHTIPHLVRISRVMYYAQRTKFVQEKYAERARAPARETISHEYLKPFSEECDRVMQKLIANNESVMLPLMTRDSPRELQESMEMILDKSYPWLRIFRIGSGFPSDKFVNVTGALRLNPSSSMSLGSDEDNVPDHPGLSHAKSK